MHGARWAMAGCILMSCAYRPHMHGMQRTKSSSHKYSEVKAQDLPEISQLCKNIPREAVRMLFEFCENCVHGFGVAHILLVSLIIVQHHQDLDQQGLRVQTTGLIQHLQVALVQQHKTGHQNWVT